MYKEQINKDEAILYIDVNCWHCKRRVAYSNTIEYKGRRYCYRCDERLRPFDKLLDKVKED